VLAGRAGAAEKPIRGIFPILATPFTATKEIDYEDLAAEVGFLERCGVHGMVWPQLASEYTTLSRDERMRGMEVLAKAAKGRRPALVLGVQAPDTPTAVEYARRAEALGADGMIAIPPREARSIEDFRQYYRSLAKVTTRPLFVQTSGGAPGVVPSIEFLVELAREFPQVAYVKEEFSPVVERMIALAKQRPIIKGIFSGNHGLNLLYEMRLGMDGTCPASPVADAYVRIWDRYHAGEIETARDIFSKLLLIINLEQQIPGTYLYLLKKRKVFKTTVSRMRETQLTAAAVEEIEFAFTALKPYLSA
jgi:dihydrodipicolinate synthase/N-acetylneuraminate lyase